MKSTVDRAIERWRVTGQSGSASDLADQLVQAGIEGGVYLRWIVECSGDPSVPLEAICRAIARLESKQALDFLAKVLEFKTSKDRRAGVMGLALVEKKEAIPLLIHALEDQSGDGWKTAMEALYALGTKLGEADRIIDQIERKMEKAKYKLGLAQTLLKFGGNRSHDAVRELSRNNDDEESLATMLATLPDWGIREDAEMIRIFLKHRNPTIRRDASSAVARLKDSEAIPDLIDLLGDENAGVQGNAHMALKVLTKQVLGPDPRVWKEWWDGGGKKILTEKADK